MYLYITFYTERKTSTCSIDLCTRKLSMEQFAIISNQHYEPAVNILNLNEDLELITSIDINSQTCLLQPLTVSNIYSNHYIQVQCSFYREI